MSRAHPKSLTPAVLVALAISGVIGYGAAGWASGSLPVPAACRSAAIPATTTDVCQSYHQVVGYTTLLAGVAGAAVALSVILGLLVGGLANLQKLK